MTRRIYRIGAMILLLAIGSPGAGAQESSTSGSGQAPSQSAASATRVLPSAETVAQSRQELIQAYQREFAFLDAQRRELSQQLDTLKATQTEQTAALEEDIRTLEANLVAMRARADAIQAQLSQAQRAETTNAGAQELLRTAYSQADATFSQYDRNLITPAFGEAGAKAQVGTLFSRALDLLGALQSIRTTPGEFFLADGAQVDGTLIHVGNIATFGVSERGAGALVPAGGGELKLWKAPSGGDARALLQGEPPNPMHLFLYESLATPVNAQDAETVVEHINSGGLTSWIIVALGLLALVLIIARAFFLRRASANMGRTTNKAAAMIREGRTEDALETCKRAPGSAARVMAAAIHNLDHNREHIEDIISEAVLHERTHLNRFGTFILVISTVAPLLGLLGTVTGMISTFDVITEFGAGNPQLLSSGIAVAMVNTELGLAVAIPALLFGSLLSGWAERIKDDMEYSALKVVNQHQNNRLRIERQAA